MIWTWFKDDWLISSQAAKLFATSVLLVLAMTPIFLGRIQTNEMTFWARLPWAILGILGPIALFFYGSACGAIGFELIDQASGQRGCGSQFF
jgi:hypothetical protein